jgi:hypothetical protein
VRCHEVDQIDLTDEDLFGHQADRTIWELENVCMTSNCLVCKGFFR